MAPLRWMRTGLVALVVFGPPAMVACGLGVQYQATPDTVACSGAATAPLDAGLALSHPVTLCCP